MNRPSEKRGHTQVEGKKESINETGEDKRLFNLDRKGEGASL